MRTTDLDYSLPDDRIAREPPADRDGGRLLVLRRSGGAIEHAMVRDLPALLPDRGLLVVNDTKVIPARLLGHKPSGGRCEVFLLRPHDEHWEHWHALARATHRVRAGTDIAVDDDLVVHVEARRDDGTFDVTLRSKDPRAAIDRCGETPLPPYLNRKARPTDRERYQTVYAENAGAVAAPTAGLHLSTALLEQIAQRGHERVAVTLHVGAGTFSPVQVDDLDQHRMHSERYEIPNATAKAVRVARKDGRPIVAIGTTTVRALESWALDDAHQDGDTQLLIQPGAEFRVVDALLTNFHLPRSTLLALVMAFAGVENTRAAYAAAIREGYRFYSYGDAMLVV